MENSEHSEALLIGRDIPWEAIEGEFCRVKHFTPLAIVESGKVKSASSMLPYASLLVELPKLKNAHLPHEASMPVVHKDDFLRLWQVFNERGVHSEEEVIVCYEPFYRSKFFSRLTPRLHIYIFQKGHHDQTYDPSFRPDDAEAWLTPIAEYRPKNYKYHR